MTHASADRYGSDRSCYELVSGARRAGHDVEVLLPYEGPLAAWFRADGVTVHIQTGVILRRADLRLAQIPMYTPRLISALIGLIRFGARNDRFELVHAHCAPNLSGYVLSRLWHVPLVWQLHEILTGRSEKLLFGSFLRAADLIVANSTATKSQLSRHLRARTIVAYSGLRVSPNISERIPLQGDTARIVCVGRLNRWKGQDVLIKAVREVRSRGLNAVLYLIGGSFRNQPHFEQALRLLVEKLEMSNDVIFLGERLDAQELMAKADLIVLPSVHPEPFGRVMIEAMALGRPVIATDGGGPREVIEDGVNGLLVPMGSESAMATAIGYLISHPHLARTMGERARMRSKSFGPEVLVDKVLDGWLGVMARQGAGQPSGVTAAEGR